MRGLLQIYFFLNYLSIDLKANSALVYVWFSPNWRMTRKENKLSHSSSFVFSFKIVIWSCNKLNFRGLILPVFALFNDKTVY